MQPDVWEIDVPEAEWDAALAAMAGHPLQSSVWGRARRHVDGIVDHRIALYRGGVPILLARVERRKLPLQIGTVGWIPRGPVGALTQRSVVGLNEQLRKLGLLLVVSDPYIQVDASPEAEESSLPKTIWVDTSIGEDRLWKNLNGRWRRCIRTSRRDGVEVMETRKQEDIMVFANNCESLSMQKGFSMVGSAELIREVLHTTPTADIETRLFIAKYDGESVGGMCVIRCGHSLHYMWGETDRRYSRKEVGKAMHWCLLQWAANNNISRYDLEGIDPKNNPGVYNVKCKVGGQEIFLHGIKATPLGLRGHLLQWVGQIIGRW